MRQYKQLLLNDAIRIFIFDRKVFCAPASIRYYQDNLDLFGSFCAGIGIEEMSLIGADTLKMFVIYLRDNRHLKATSIHTVFRAVNAFLRFLMEEEYIPEFRYRIKLPRQNPEQVMPLTTYEVQQLLQTIACTSMNVQRDALMFRLLLELGLRSSEVRHVRRKDINLQSKVLTVSYSKFDKSRLLPLPDSLCEWLRYYMEHCIPADQEYLFTGEDGEPMSANAIKQFFGKLKKRSGIKRVHAHLLRHTFATSYMMKRGNIEFLRIYLGHADYNVTKGYVHLANQCFLTHIDVYQIDDCFR